MPYHDRRAQIERGRKAGLQTQELYSALSNRAISSQELAQETVDANGYSAAVNADGRVYYRPNGSTR
ncbi:MAG: hypothetical protein RMJ19_00785 [Gemmatales bacterium]|nr:hypothetical protein [Gemmatales bacterium]MCS7158980.1 hypothetical protein [Gemmatales bacterium]MDW8174180.1 hypothetical protein [Gemmatales bacterium]MDW8224044.1 hypothetical protein [Gemmatales bacterium]